MNNRGRPFDRRRGGFRGFGGGPRGPVPPFRGRGWAPRGGYAPRPFYPPRRVVDHRPGKRLSEAELGISEYVSALPGFRGIIKSRFADFQVSEVSLEGEVARLSDLSVPQSGAPDLAAALDDDSVLDKYNLEALPLQTWDVLNQVVLSADQAARHEVDVTHMTKEERTHVYDAIEKAFGKRLFGKTVSVDERKLILFTKVPSARGDRREKWRWPGKYVHFVLHKENLDTMEAASHLAAALRLNYIKPQFFGYCGTKDRRAKTSQWFSLRNVEPTRIHSACRRLRNITVGNFQFKDYQLYLGYLRGNVFKIALRNVTASAEVIDRTMEHLRQRGFVNYFGLQRFGACAEIPTHRIGQYILQKKYQAAFDLILEPRGELAQALAVYRQTKNARRALQVIPNTTAQSIELKLLSGIAQCNKNDFVAVLDRIPRNTRLLYLHSYQSWVWNRCVSERIKRYKFNLRVGDLVPEDPQEDIDDSTVFFEEEMWSSNASKDDDDEKPDEAENKEFNKQEADLQNSTLDLPSRDKKDMKVKPLTQEDLDSGSYSIYDLVLPLPGHKVQYPPNMEDFYAAITRMDEVDLNVKQRVKAYNLSGTYRKMLLKPEKLSWTTLQYTDPFCDLILSDLDLLKNKPPIESVPDGKFTALVIEMMLRSSTYATMALREILKSDTSSESQALQNDYYKDTTSSEVGQSEAPAGGTKEDTEVSNVSVSEATDGAMSEVTDGTVSEATDGTGTGAESGKRKLEGELEETKRVKLG